MQGFRGLNDRKKVAAMKVEKSTPKSDNLKDEREAAEKKSSEVQHFQPKNVMTTV